MRLRLLNLTYLAVAVIASSWVLSDLYSAIVLAGTTGTAWSEGTIAAFFNIPILAGILILLFAFYKYPTRTGDQISNLRTGNKVVSPPLKQTSEKISREKQLSQDKETRDAHGDSDSNLNRVNNTRERHPSRGKEARDAHADSDNSLNTESTKLSMDSTTLDVDDYFLNPPKDDGYEDNREVSHTGELLDNIDQAKPHSLEPLIEAQVLVKFGRNDHAIEMLLDAFSNSDSKSDAIATQVMTIVNDELNSESTSSARAYHLRLKRNEIVIRFSKERAKLSDVTWKKIQLENPTQKKIEYSDPVDILTMRSRA